MNAITQKLALFYDTETTGLPLFSEPSEHPGQPHMVQLAAALVDLDTRKTISSIDLVICPDNWSIPAEVAAIHGITTELAEHVGVPEEAALGLFLDLWMCSSVRIAHNESFDARIIRIAQHRHDEGAMDEWKAGPAECTAKLATPIVRCPPTEKMRAAGRNHFKTPNLTEAHTHLLGKPFDGAHSAMADVQACIAVYFAMRDLGAAQAA